MAQRTPLGTNMLEDLHLAGTLTAIVTPFGAHGAVDTDALKALVDKQLEFAPHLIQGIVPCGSTGETATLSLHEQDMVITTVAKRVNGKIPIIVGTGSNNTTQTIARNAQVYDLGATHALVVTPYYNKPTQEGLYKHYAAIAEASPLPMIVYNVPSRTGVDLKPNIMARLQQYDCIVGIKDATGEIDRVADLRQANAQLSILSGDDGSALPFVLMGGDGVISVVSNVVPEHMGLMIHAARNHHLQQGLSIHHMLRPLFHILGCQTNPIPIKAALHIKGLIHNVLRLPLCTLSAEYETRLQHILHDLPLKPIVNDAASASQ